MHEIPSARHDFLVMSVTNVFNRSWQNVMNLMLLLLIKLRSEVRQ